MGLELKPQNQSGQQVGSKEPVEAKASKESPTCIEECRTKLPNQYEPFLLYIQCLADALPPKWESFLMVLKQIEMLATMDINDFIQKLKEQDIENKWKAKSVALVQDPSIYNYTLNVDRTTSHAPLKSAFVSQTTEARSSSHVHFNQPTTTLPLCLTQRIDILLSTLKHKILIK
ncbi:hypothetical protein E3N88_29169 [Mikania micrantha]|uniref:Uncharacterized protein n=1 Tax=Mikania micrantha TaxID=192012 RepID=A0A5N6MIP1_9ASTR|nr:hypothetical protein E3N88_29169 [Mikania micrantha]